jgi:hypothetical protein
MTDSVLIALITASTSIIVAIITVIVKSWLDIKSAEKKAHQDVTIHDDDIGEMVYIHEFIEELRIEYSLDRVAICQFHNGGKFLNGRSIKKFSMTYETTAAGIEKIKRRYQNVLVSEFPKMFAAILKTNFMIVSDSNDYEFPDLKREMQTHGIIQAIKVPIRGLRGDILGFITCHSIGERNDLIGNHLRHEFVDKANQISGYLLK